MFVFEVLSGSHYTYIAASSKKEAKEIHNGLYPEKKVREVIKRGRVNQTSNSICVNLQVGGVN